MFGKEIKHIYAEYVTKGYEPYTGKRPAEDDSNKGFEIYMPGKDIGHIKIEYTCSVRILNTYREHMSDKDIRHTLERDRLEQTHWGKDIWNGKIVDRRRIHGERGQTKGTLARIAKLCWTLKGCKCARNTISLRPKAGCTSLRVAII